MLLSSQDFCVDINTQVRCGTVKNPAVEGAEYNGGHCSRKHGQTMHRDSETYMARAMQLQRLLGKSTIGSGNRGYEPALQHRRC